MAKTIEQYQRDYQEAKARGDSAGMIAANQGANAIRAAQGQAAVSASDDIGMVARSGSVVSPTTIMAQQKPSIMSGQDIAGNYGLTYDFKTLDRLLKNSIEKKYKTLENDLLQSEQKTTDQIYGLQQDMLDAAKRNRGSAITGQSLGAYLANDLLSTLGWQQETSGLQTEMAQERQQLADKKASDIAAATETAMQMANSTGLSMAEIATMFDASATQDNVGLRDALARLYDSNAGLEAARVGADATKYAANMNAAAARSYGGGGGGSYGTNQEPSFNSIEDIVKRRSYGDFYYLMANTGMKAADIKSLWEELTKTADLNGGSLSSPGAANGANWGAFQMYHGANSIAPNPEIVRMLEQAPWLRALNPILKNY